MVRLSWENLNFDLAIELCMEAFENSESTRLNHLATIMLGLSRIMHGKVTSLSNLAAEWFSANRIVRVSQILYTSNGLTARSICNSHTFQSSDQSDWDEDDDNGEGALDSAGDASREIVQVGQSMLIRTCQNMGKLASHKRVQPNDSPLSFKRLRVESDPSPDVASGSIAHSIHNQIATPNEDQRISRKFTTTKSRKGKQLRVDIKKETDSLSDEPQDPGAFEAFWLSSVTPFAATKIKCNFDCTPTTTARDMLKGPLRKIHEMLRRFYKKRPWKQAGQDETVSKDETLSVFKDQQAEVEENQAIEQACFGDECTSSLSIDGELSSLSLSNDDEQHDLSSQIDDWNCPIVLLKDMEKQCAEVLQKLSNEPVENEDIENQCAEVLQKPPNEPMEENLDQAGDRTPSLDVPAKPSKDCAPDNSHIDCEAVITALQQKGAKVLEKLIASKEIFKVGHEPSMPVTKGRAVAHFIEILTLLNKVAFDLKTVRPSDDGE